MKEMTARYPGICKACGKSISPGDKIKFYGRGHAEHGDCDLPSPAESRWVAGEDARMGLEPGTLTSDRRLARQGLSVVRLSSGAVLTQNSRGRCEDAPCCGCCS